MNKHSTELLEKHFDTAFASPDGIKKLRELILTLAMRGKLVPQDSNEQPASELLKEIDAENSKINAEEAKRQADAAWSSILSRAKNAGNGSRRRARPAGPRC